MNIFFSGIAGSGMSAIAGFMSERGHHVSGSDRAFDLNPDHSLLPKLRAKGIRIFPQDGSGLATLPELAVFSTAVEHINPDFSTAADSGIPVKTRPEFLAQLTSEFRTIAVAGTSGKSTTSGMLAYMMQRLGMAPNFIGGGKVKQFRTPANAGNYLAGASDFLVIEACESDGSIVNYRPGYSLILNLDLDHHSIAETAGMFRELAGQTRGLLITGADDPNLVQSGIQGAGFSIDAPSAYRATELRCGPFGSSFTVRSTKFGLRLPGRHNVSNALACIALLSEMGRGASEISEALGGFEGIERRFDVHLNEDLHVVVDDYAHNPHKIAHLFDTMRAISGKTCYIFQPHGYGPTRLMKDGYIDVFSSLLRDSDILMLLPIFYAGGTAARDISSRDIADGVKLSGKKVEVIENRYDLIRMKKEWDAYVVFGARDDSLSDLAEAIAQEIRKA